LFTLLKLVIFSWFIIILSILSGSGRLAEAADKTQLERDQPYTFVPAPCDFLDITQLPLLSQSLEDQGYTCGYVIVPEQHAHPDGPTIRLPVAILPVIDPNLKPDPLFVAQGGPGGSAFEIFPYSLPGTAIAAERDIVMFNQRGTQFANPELICTETLEGMAELVSLPYDEATAYSLELLLDCHQRLESDGLNFSAYNSLENALDVEAIRQALDYEAYNFYGVSYGTLLGLHLMRAQPEGLRSVILDGVLPPDLNFILYVPQNENRIYDELFQYCSNDPVCRSNYPDLEERLFDLVEKLDENPDTLRLVDPETGEVAHGRLDGKGLMEIFFQFFYIEDSYALFPRLVSAVEKGDYLVVETLWSLIAYDRSFSEGMYYSVICAEDADFDPDEAPLDGVRPQIAASVKDDLQAYLDACDFWRVNLLPPSIDNPVQSDIPTLLLSGQFDPITPPSFAATAAESLTTAYNIIDPVGSHGVAFSDACMNAIIQDFLNDPGTSPDTACLDSPERWEELVPVDAVTLPVLAPLAQLDEDFLLQVGFAGVLLMIVLSAYVIWPLAWLIDRIRRVEREMSQQQKRLRTISRGLVLVFGFLAMIFVVAMMSFVTLTLFSLPTFLSVYSVPGSARPFLYIPYILLLLVAFMLVITLVLWRNHVGSTWERLYYLFLGLCAAGYIGLLGYHGFLSI
jgi:pimeloyl-ACP methyl ester carboxylesterase